MVNQQLFSDAFYMTILSLVVLDLALRRWHLQFLSVQQAHKCIVNAYWREGKGMGEVHSNQKSKQNNRVHIRAQLRWNVFIQAKAANQLTADYVSSSEIDWGDNPGTFNKRTIDVAWSVSAAALMVWGLFANGLGPKKAATVFKVEFHPPSKALCSLTSCVVPLAMHLVLTPLLPQPQQHS